MHLTWHIIKKDLRRFWPVSLFLAVLVLLECYCGFVLLSPGDGFDTTLFNRISGYSGILANLQVLVVVVFTAAVIHEDGFVGTSRHWMTRPISNRRLLAAKGGAIVLLIVIMHGIAAIPLWLYAGWEPDQLAWGAAKMCALGCAVVLLCAPFALVTPNLSRYLLSILFALLVFVFMIFTFSRMGPWSANHIAPALSTSRAVIAGWLLVGVSVSVIVIQLWRGLTALAVKVFTGGTLAWIMVSVFWPWAIPNLGTSNQPESSLTAGIVARNHSSTRSAGALNDYMFNLTFELTNIPKGNFITGAMAPGRLIWPGDDETIIAGAPVAMSLEVPNLRQLLDVDGDRVEPFTTVRPTSRLNIPASLRERFKATPASYEMIGHFSLHSPELWGETPLNAGARIAKSGHTIHIVDEQGGPEGRLVHLLESKPSLQRSSLGSSASGLVYERTLRHFLINRRLGRIYRSQRLQDSDEFRRCSIAHVEIVWRKITFKGILDNFPDHGLDTDQELTLATIGSKEVASFRRRILFPSTMLTVP